MAAGLTTAVWRVSTLGIFGTIKAPKSWLRAPPAMPSIAAIARIKKMATGIGIEDVVSKEVVQRCAAGFFAACADR